MSSGRNMSSTETSTLHYKRLPQLEYTWTTKTIQREREQQYCDYSLDVHGDTQTSDALNFSCHNGWRQCEPHNDCGTANPTHI